ncbi:MAG: hypothetical protein ACREO4_14045 [Lysobacter sp.]
MNRRCALLFAALFPLVGGCRQPANTYQQATIRWTDEQACFSVADTDESRRTPPTVAAISVSQFNDGQWVRLWVSAAPLSPPTTLAPRQCISYGHGFAGAAGKGSVAPPLVAGGRYGVEINAQVPNPRAGGDRMVSRRYSGHFCLQSSGNGGSTLIEVPRVRGDLAWEVCGQPVAGEAGGE